MAEIHDNSRNVKAAVDRAIQQALEMCGGIGESAVKQRLTDNGSVDTGLLRNSITYAIGGQTPKIASYRANRAKGISIKGKGKVKDDVVEGQYTGTAPEDEPGQHTVYIGTNVEYAPHVELGTIKMAAKPYLRPAVEEARRQFELAIQLAFKDIN